MPLESMLRGLIGFFNLPMSAFSLGADNQTPFTVQGESLHRNMLREWSIPIWLPVMVVAHRHCLTVSNDAWFGSSLRPQQHMQMAQMRALENAKPMMRGTNNGVTALVNHRGEIYQQPRAIYARRAGRALLHPAMGRTVFSQTGSWPTVILALLSCIGLLMKQRLRISALKRTKTK